MSQWPDLIRVNEEKREAHHLDQDVFFSRGQISLALEHGEASVDNVAEKLFVVLDDFQCVFQVVSDLALSGQEHGEVLGLLQSVTVRHHLEKLRRSSVGGVVVLHRGLHVLQLVEHWKQASVTQGLFLRLIQLKLAVSSFFFF